MVHSHLLYMLYHRNQATAAIYSQTYYLARTSNTMVWKCSYIFFSDLKNSTTEISLTIMHRCFTFIFHGAVITVKSCVTRKCLE